MEQHPMDDIENRIENCDGPKDAPTMRAGGAVVIGRLTTVIANYL
jgi:hypothetical protein